VIGVGQCLVACRGDRGGIATSFGMNLVIPGQLGEPAAGRALGRPVSGQGEHLGDVGIGATGQGDVGVLASSVPVIIARPMCTVRPWAAWPVIT
jgi:hypothetical protein